MENTIIQRLCRLLEDNNLSVSAFAKSIDMNQVTANDYFLGKRKIAFALIETTLSHYPNLSAEWLLRGVGDMYLPNDTVENSNNNAEENYLKETIELLKSNIEDLKETIVAQRETIIAQRNENALLKKETDYIQENHIVCAAHSAKPHIV